MKDSILHKLHILSERYAAIESSLADESVITDQKKFQELSKELHVISPVVLAYKRYKDFEESLQQTEAMLAETELDMRDLIQDEMQSLRNQIVAQEAEILTLLLPKDPDDDRNIYLEIRAGTGGDEAALFAGDLMRMYHFFAQKKHWKWSVVQANESEQGGFKEIVVHVTGKDVFAHLKYESGTHRVQRVPSTESQGRIHTSACTVAILPEVEEIDDIDIDPSTIKMDTFRSSGAGGQHVNTTDSAVRLTHLPTGVVVECQDERSQHKNRAKALGVLKAKILSMQRESQLAERAEQRRIQVGSGDRSERIRTYNFPQGRVTDHRINLTLYKLDLVLAGDLGFLVDPLTQEDQADKMSQLQDS